MNTKKEMKIWKIFLNKKEVLHMKHENRLLRILKYFFKKIFKNNKQLALKESNDSIDFKFNDNIKDDLQIETSIKEKNQNKKEFIVLYMNVKKGLIKLEDLMIPELIKILSMSEEEIKILDSKINEFMV